jgi:hypothetical protein
LTTEAGLGASTGEGGASEDGGTPCNNRLDCDRILFVTSETFTGNLGGLYCLEQ